MIDLSGSPAVACSVLLGEPVVSLGLSACAVLPGKAFTNCSESETQPSNASAFKSEASWFVLGKSWPMGSLMQSLSKTQR